MRVWVRGSGRADLSKKSFVGQGGQASVYAKAGVAYKIYTDPSHMLPEGKLSELDAISDPRIIKPEQIICKTKQGPAIGYTMRHIKDAFVLCQLFSRAFRSRHGVDSAQIMHLVDELRAGIESVHQAGVLLVDGNELNFLVSRDFKNLFFVDVDSYQTASYPATAIMDSIRDRYLPAGEFNEGSDWFAFAIVAFQLFVGIHPFKGKHDRVRGLDARMQARLSVFHKEVRLPKTAYPLSTIPPGYREWFRRVFEEGWREAPPESTSAPRPTKVVLAPVRAGATLRYRTLESRDEEIRGSYTRGPHLVTVTSSGIWHQHRRVAATPCDFVGIAFGPGDQPLAVSATMASLRVVDLTTGVETELPMNVQSALTHNGRIYVHHGSKVSEVRVVRTGAGMTLTLSLAVNVLAHATQLWPGFVFQNLLGTAYLSLLPHAGHSYQLAIPELSGSTLVDAHFDGNVLVATAHREGRMDRLVLRFDDSFQSYDCRIVEDVEVATANLAVLDTGVCLCLNEDEELEIFHCRKGSTKLELITDTSLCGDMKLSSRGGHALVASQGSLYRIQMA
jgi:hypothetical protein